MIFDDEFINTLFSFAEVKENERFYFILSWIFTLMPQTLLFINGMFKSNLKS